MMCNVDAQICEFCIEIFSLHQQILRQSGWMLYYEVYASNSTSERLKFCSRFLHCAIFLNCSIVHALYVSYQALSTTRRLILALHRRAVAGPLYFSCEKCILMFTLGYRVCKKFNSSKINLKWQRSFQLKLWRMEI